ncbi:MULTISPECIES: exopolysaccharide biosynthesis protein [unclassified Sphingomonas]|uniref:exopolysaccharide biosynthesis protein n=1 Tax=unclassified Sphingomonas TaxID=196159 RepID=UPI001F43268C|nr:MULTISPECIES: exopolysaccharide biosynthesis protein [unclassified Sphingomonas]
MERSVGKCMADNDKSGDPHSVSEVLDRLRELGGQAGDDKAKLGDALEALGQRAYGPFFIIFPLIDISPVGGIPGLPTAMAVVMILLAAQLVLGRKHLWLPGFLANRGLKGAKLVKVADKTRPIARRMDQWFHGRLPALTKGPMVKVAGVAVILLCLTVPPLELLPFASTAPMAAIMAFGIALLVRDGLLMIVACALSVGAVALGAGLFASKAG